MNGNFGMEILVHPGTFGIFMIDALARIQCVVRFFWELLDRHACCRLKNHTGYPRPTCLFWQLSSFWCRKSIAFMQTLRLLCDFFMLIRLICPVLHVEHLCFIWFLYKNCGPLSNQVAYSVKTVWTASLYFYFYVPERSFDTSNNLPGPVKVVNDNLSNFIS